jgi:ribosomal protein L2
MKLSGVCGWKKSAVAEGRAFDGRTSLRLDSGRTRRVHNSCRAFSLLSLGTKAPVT